MNSIRNLAVEFETRTITVSAKFLKQSRVYGSDEFHTMLNLTKELPGFEIRVRRVSKFAHRPFMPTYDTPNANGVKAGFPCQCFQLLHRVNMICIADASFSRVHCRQKRINVVVTDDFFGFVSPDGRFINGKLVSG